MAVYARLGVVIDQRHADVGQQHGERHAVRVAAKAADQPYQQTDQRAENQPAFIGGRGGNRVGSDKNAPSIVAPEKRWISGEASVPGEKTNPTSRTPPAKP